jgi:DNA polymerase-3 subunit gamma/tau
MERLRDAAPESARLVAVSTVAEVQPGDVLMMSFPSQGAMNGFRGAASDDLRTAILGVLGVRVKYRARVDAPSDDVPPPPDDDPDPGPDDEPAGPAAPPRQSAYAAPPAAGWAVAPIPGSIAPMAPPSLAVHDDPEEVAAGARVATLERDGAVMPDEPPVDADDEPLPERPTVQRRQVLVPEGVERRGEAVVRQILGARFLHEEPYEPPTRFA